MSSDLPVPKPKPRARYKRDRLHSQQSASVESDLTGDNWQPASSNGEYSSTGNYNPLPPFINGSDPAYLSLASVANIISFNIPSLAGVANSITGIPPNPPPAAATPSPDPPSLDSMASSVATHIPSLAGVVSSVTNTATAPSAPALDPVTSGSNVPSLDNIVSSLAAHIPSFAGIVPCPTVAMPPNAVHHGPSTNVWPYSGAASCNGSIPTHMPGVAGASADPNVAMFHHPNLGPMAVTMPSITAPTNQMHRPPSHPTPVANSHTVPDVEALSRMVMASLDPTKDQTALLNFPSTEGPISPGPMDKVSSPSPMTIKGHDPYITVLASWGCEEEPDTESSNEEEDSGADNKPKAGELEKGPVPGCTVSTDGPVPDCTDGLVPRCTANANGHPTSQSDRGHLIPCRAPPPPPNTAKQSQEQDNARKQKTPRAATIRVSRKKGAPTPQQAKNDVVQTGWLDVWKGFRHSVLWATLDGQLMSLWKKRTDKFSEVVFHVSNITNIKKQDKGRFSIYFRKKHYDFMAHTDAVQEAWVSSLLATRGQARPTPPELHRPITIKDPRSRAYAAIWDHDLWVYHNKEDYQLGVGSFVITLKVASVKQTGKHSFSLMTPYKIFNFSVESSKDLPVWLDRLNSTIRNALSCSLVAQRLWESPFNKVCGDCGAANPEWASVNLLLLLCEPCAGHHRGMGSRVSKVRSLKLDEKVWTEPLMQLFVRYGNRVANQIWSPTIPAPEQLLPESSTEQRAKFIWDKYTRGRYRRAHPLASSQRLLNQRLCEVVCSDDVEETMFLICSGAKVCQGEDTRGVSLTSLAEKAGRTLQTELLRHNEYTEVPPYLPQLGTDCTDSIPSGDEEDEELHGKLEGDRFLFSLENESAACDVLDLREVLSVFTRPGPSYEFEMVTLTDRMICAADSQEALSSHFFHIVKVILPGGMSEAELGTVLALSKVSIMGVGGALEHPEAWAVLHLGGAIIYPAPMCSQDPMRLTIDTQTRHKMDATEHTIALVTGERTVSLCFEEDHSCQTWFSHLQFVASQNLAAPPKSPSLLPKQNSLYQLIPTGITWGKVPPAIERCISHITQHGLKVEGVYRRCGLVTKVSQLVEALTTSPSSATLEKDEQGILDTASALKQCVRRQDSLIPLDQRKLWVEAAALTDEQARLVAYRRLLRQLPCDNRATLNALCEHFYMVQIFSSENRMTSHNLAVVLVPTLFQELAMNPEMVRLTKELIIHHTLLFLSPEDDKAEEGEEQITVF